MWAKVAQEESALPVVPAATAPPLEIILWLPGAAGGPTNATPASSPASPACSPASPSPRTGVQGAVPETVTHQVSAQPSRVQREEPLQTPSAAAAEVRVVMELTPVPSLVVQEGQVSPTRSLAAGSATLVVAGVAPPRGEASAPARPQEVALVVVWGVLMGCCLHQGPPTLGAGEGAVTIQTTSTLVQMEAAALWSCGTALTEHKHR
jgi:hypothetical protein